jgi:hypothetical protein
MSTPSRHQRTRVLPATAQQPAATTEAPPAARFWRQKLPAHIGRARTSTVVLSVLLLVCGALYLSVRPDYVTVTTVDGATVRVDRSQLSTPPAPDEPAVPTPTDVPVPGLPTDTTVPAPTSDVEPTPETTAPTGTGQDDDEDTTAPAPTTSQAPATTRAPSSTRTSSSTRFPVTTQDQETDAAPEATSTPTG